jgi:hypothetical protein
MFGDRQPVQEILGFEQERSEREPNIRSNGVPNIRSMGFHRVGRIVAGATVEHLFVFDLQSSGTTSPRCEPIGEPRYLRVMLLAYHRGVSDATQIFPVVKPYFHVVGHYF